MKENRGNKSKELIQTEQFLITTTKQKMETRQNCQSQNAGIYENESYIMLDTTLQMWNNTKSTILKEQLLTRHIQRLFLNKDLKTFLFHFSHSFSETNRVHVLMLCRKILAQNSERKIDADADFIKAFEDEIDLEMSNDIEFDSANWIDAELKYLADIKQVKTENKAVRTAQAPETDWLNKEQTCERYKFSASTFDRLRKNGFPCKKHGKKLLVNRDVADSWITENSTIKKRFRWLNDSRT